MSRLCRSRCSFSCRCCRSEEHTSELQSQSNLVCRLLLVKKKNLLFNTTHPLDNDNIKSVIRLVRSFSHHLSCRCEQRTPPGQRRSSCCRVVSGLQLALRS